jgi:hypothetical protein
MNINTGRLVRVSQRNITQSTIQNARERWESWINEMTDIDRLTIELNRTSIPRKRVIINNRIQSIRNN